MEATEKATDPTKALVTALLIILVALVLLHVQPAAADLDSGRVLDLYTQKTPYDGKGINQSSDAFQPQELVILYALVTYNGDPVANKLVGIQVIGPPNSVQNLTITGSSPSDQNGIASFSFRVPWLTNDPEKIVFGKWFAVATVDIAGQTANDTLTFQVGWIIRITSIVTLDSQLTPKKTFVTGDTVVFNLTVENIARTPRLATTTIDVQDAAARAIMHLQMEDQLFQSGTNYVNASSQVPINASIGTATAVAAPYTTLPEKGGVLYSPSISTNFAILGPGNVTRDVAVVAVNPSRTSALPGETIEIVVTVKNKGGETETFNVTLYFDNNVISKRLVKELTPSAESQLLFEWDTSEVIPGTYAIKAVADKVEGETNIEDNTFVDGTVTIEQLPPGLPASYFTIFLTFISAIAIIASLVLLLLLYFLRKRAKKKPPSPRFAIIIHPHI